MGVFFLREETKYRHDFLPTIMKEMQSNLLMEYTFQ